MAALSVLDTTVQKTHEWLGDIKRGLQVENGRTAYAALRDTLHALRDQLNTEPDDRRSHSAAIWRRRSAISTG